MKVKSIQVIWNRLLWRIKNQIRSLDLWNYRKMRIQITNDEILHPCNKRLNLPLRYKSWFPMTSQSKKFREKSMALIQVVVALVNNKALIYLLKILQQQRYRNRQNHLKAKNKAKTKEKIVHRKTKRSQRSNQLITSSRQKNQRI